MTLLTIQNLTKKYGAKENEVIALNGINLAVEEGTFVSIIGPSGCGKSTLLHLIAGIDMPTSGMIKIGQTKVSELSTNEMTLFRRRNIRLVYQFFNLLPSLNVKENIILPLKLDHQKIDMGEVEELLEIFHLKDRQHHLPSQLSGGQQQRVAFARAVITKPMLLLADEPTGNLDQKNSKEIMEYIQRIHKQTKNTIILVTHNETIAETADRVISMEDGRIVKDEGLVHEDTI